MSFVTKTDNKLRRLENSMNISISTGARMEISRRNDINANTGKDIINSTGTRRQEWINYFRKLITTYSECDKQRAINSAKQLIPEFTM